MDVKHHHQKILFYYLFVSEVIFIILYGVFVRYDTVANTITAGSDNSLHQYYSMFQDVHVMIFIGFGFLMTYLKRYGYSSVGFNFLIAAYVIQLSTLLGGFLRLDNGKININIINLLTSDFAAAAVLISFGAVLGKLNPLQLIIMATFEVLFFHLNEWNGYTFVKAVDVGGSIFVHVFGAYFGLAVSKVTHRVSSKDACYEDKLNPVYNSDISAMIGTLFLWVFWPSFNGAIALDGDDQHRAVINTYYSLAASCIFAFIFSVRLNKNKFDMVHVQNATLAGGVALGAVADMMILPVGAIVIGGVAGIISVVGYQKISPWLQTHVCLHDTCGVHNLHGLPGVFSALISMIVVGIASEDTYGTSLYELFPARAPQNGTAELVALQLTGAVSPGEGRSPTIQALCQLLVLSITFVGAILTGALTGFIIRLPLFGNLIREECYEDEVHWDCPIESYPEATVRPHSCSPRPHSVSCVSPMVIQSTSAPEPVSYLTLPGTK